MKNVNLLTVCTWLYEKLILVVIVTLLCAAAFGYNGYKKSGGGLSLQEQEKLDNFNKALEEYDATIANAENSQAAAQREMEDQRRYVDESLYMKLNPSDYCVATLQYAVTEPEVEKPQAEEEAVGTQPTTDVARVLASYVQFVNSGGYYAFLASNSGVEGVTESYLRELGWVGTNNNVLIMTVMMPDEDSANKLLDPMKKAIDSRRESITIAQGEYNIYLLEENVAHAASADVLARQQANLNNLRSYNGTSSDHDIAVVNARNSKDSYIEDNQPSVKGTKNPKKEFIKGGIFGAAVGLALCFAIAFMFYLMSDRLKSYEDLLFAGIPVLGRKGKKGYVKDLPSMKDEYEAIAALKKIPLSDAALYPLCVSKKAAQTIEELTKECGLSQDTTLKGVGEKGHAILLTQTGVTTYGQIEEARKLFENLGVDIWGSIVIE